MAVCFKEKISYCCCYHYCKTSHVNRDVNNYDKQSRYLQNVTGGLYSLKTESA